MHSTNYTLLYILGVTAVPAILLAAMFTFLKPIHDSNEANYNKKQILSSLNTTLGTDATKMSDDEVSELFKNVEQLVVDYEGNVIPADSDRLFGQKAEDINMEKEEKKTSDAERNYPVFVYKKDSKKYYILSVRGNGLWDKIWGWVALEDDLKTVAGVAFGHKAETPGLGAEISDNTGWKNKFVGKKIYNNEGKYTSVYIRKGGAKDPLYEVDGISGATVTSDGVNVMLFDGIQAYQPYLATIK